ncbi:MAG TPA: hypothetical protein VIN00_03760 [Candidatus Dormibacteraeota bacterium]
MGAPNPLRLRPLEIGDLLDETFRMYRRNFFLFAGLSVILSIPQAALAGFTYHAFSGLLQVTNPAQPPDLSVLTSTLAADGIFFLVILALLPFSYGAVTYAACESALGRPITLPGVISGVLRRYFQLLGFGLLIVAMAVAFCIFPLWIWILVGWAVLIPVMFIENVGLGAAMSRSWRLVQGRWWRTFLILFLMFVLSYVVSFALSAFITLGQTVLQLVVSPVVVLWISGATSVIVGSLVDPVIQIALVLIYFDLRVRREGLDLFQLAQQVTAPSPAPAL